MRLVSLAFCKNAALSPWRSGLTPRQCPFRWPPPPSRTSKIAERSPANKEAGMARARAGTIVWASSTSRRSAPEIKSVQQKKNRRTTSYEAKQQNEWPRSPLKRLHEKEKRQDHGQKRKYRLEANTDGKLAEQKGPQKHSNSLFRTAIHFLTAQESAQGKEAEKNKKHLEFRKTSKGKGLGSTWGFKWSMKSGIALPIGAEPPRIGY